MLLLDLTLPTAAENVVLDEALLEEAEARPGASELLRLWEPATPTVVLGRSSRPEHRGRSVVLPKTGHFGRAAHERRGRDRHRPRMLDVCRGVVDRSGARS